MANLDFETAYENDISEMWHTEIARASLNEGVRYILGCDVHIVLSTDDKAEQEMEEDTTVEWKKKPCKRKNCSSK